MVNAYAAPRLVSLPAAPAAVDNEWGVAVIVAILLGIAAAVVYAVCWYCGTLYSWQACFWTIYWWIQGYWCW